jgi:hypothetical protein
VDRPRIFAVTSVVMARSIPRLAKAMAAVLMGLAIAAAVAATNNGFQQVK